MTAIGFQYVSPFVYPLFPERAGRLAFSCSVKNALDFRALPNFSGTIAVNFKTVVGGVVAKDRVEIAVVEHKPAVAEFSKEFSSADFGYVEVMMTADKPVFDKAVVVQGYGLFLRPGRGALTFGSDLKYARDPIVHQISVYGRFCLLHAAAYVDRKAGIGNSFMLINPYEQAIVCTLASDTGRRKRVRVEAGSTQMFSLDQLLDDGRIGTVMITASNKLTVFDVRHAYGDSADITNVDHLDFMNGWMTYRRDTVAKTSKYYLRRAARFLGLRYA